MLLRASVVPFLLLLVAASDHAASDPRDWQGDEHAEARAKLERGLATLRTAAADWPDTTVLAIGERLATPAACLAFVRLRVRHEPYAGIMRGSQGVLDAAGGNSAELCLLLRDLIAAGGAAPRMRFAIAELAEADATRLVDATMQRPAFRPAGLLPAAKPAPVAAPSPSPASAARLQNAATETKRTLRDANADVEQLGELLGELLGEDTADDRSAAIRAARTHVWLQFEQEDGKWVSFDPTADLEPPADARCVDQLPTDWQHMVALDLAVERLQDGKLARESLFAQQWPAADLQGRAIEVLLVPEGLSMQKLLAASERSEDFLAQAKAFTRFGVLVGVTGAGLQPGKTFDLEGRTQASAASHPLGVGIVDPFRRLPRGGAVAAKSELAGVFLTIRLRGPDGSERVVERALLDRVGASARAANAPAVAAAWAAPERVKVALLQRHLLFAPAGAGGPVRAARGVLDSLVLEPCLLAALDLEYGKFKGNVEGAFAGLPEVPADLVGLSDTSLALVEAATAGDGFAFLTQPNLYLRDETLDLGDGDTLVPGTGIDVALHGIALLGKGTGEARRLHGCLVSEMEGSSSGDPARWAAALLRSARARGTGLVPVRTATDLGKIEADADAKAVMAAELARGNTLLAMASPVRIGSTPCTAWWRVDAAGHVLAVGSDGRGQGTEGMTVLKDISIPMVRRCMTFVACLNSAVAGGDSMQAAGGSCLANAIRDIVKQSLDKTIDTFVKEPLQGRVDAARAGMLGDDYEKLYQKAQAAWGRYQQAQAAIDDPISLIPHGSDVADAGRDAIRGGADIGSAFGGKIYLMLVMGRDIADYSSRR